VGLEAPRGGGRAQTQLGWVLLVLVVCSAGMQVVCASHSRSFSGLELAAIRAALY